MKKEYYYACLIGLFVLLLVNLPILYFSIIGKTGLTFLGRRVINSQDMYTYISYVEQAKQGKVLFKNLFTSEPHTASLLRPSYVVIGKTASLFQLPSVVSYHVFRVIFTLLFYVVLYQFIARLFHRPKQRLLVFALVLTSSGLGWALSTVIGSSSDLWIPESNTFLMLAESPHFILAQTVLLGGFLLFLRYIERRNILTALGFILCFSLLAFEHPFNLLLVGPVLFIAGIRYGLPLIETGILGALSSLGLIYPLYELRTNAIFAIEQSQGKSVSPAPSAFLAGMGLLLPLALIGASLWIEKKDKPKQLILLWVAFASLFLYAPISFQRRMSEGIHIPLALLAGAGLVFLYSKIKSRWPNLKHILPATICLLLFLSLSSVRAIADDFLTIGKDSRDGYYYYLLSDEGKAMDWLRSHSTETDVILTNWFYGNILAGRSARTVYLGHKAQTGHYDEKVSSVNTFLLEADSQKSLDFLWKERISFIFIGKNDSLSRYGFKPDSKPYLTKVYDAGDVRIYKLNQTNPTSVQSQFRPEMEEEKK